MRFDMLLQILWTLESLSAKIAFVRLERNMNTDMGCDVIALDCRSTTVAPLAGQVQVIRALAANVTLADVVLETKSASRCAETWQIRT